LEKAMLGTFCRERDEMEMRINALLRELSDSSRKASELAKHPGSDADFLFSSLHSSDNAIRARLETLKFCLRLHKDCHGC
jgi:hypothetical protein